MSESDQDLSDDYWEENSLRYRGLNPLLIPDIVQSIFQEFSYTELKTLRLVCRTWEYEASLFLRNRTQVRFPSDTAVTQYLSNLTSNFCCESYEFNSDIPLNSPSAQEFFHLFGSNITFLKLHQISWTGDDLWELLENHLQNLQELSIRIHIPSEIHGHFRPKENNAENLGSLSTTYLPTNPNNLPNIRWLKLSFAIERQLKTSPPPPPDVTHPRIVREIFEAFPNCNARISPEILRIHQTTSSVHEDDNLLGFGETQETKNRRSCDLPRDHHHRQQ